MRVTCRLNGCLRPSHGVIHSLLGGDPHTLGLLPEVGPNSVILVAHEGLLWWDHWDGATIADLSFILIRILQQLQSIANLALVEAV